MLHEDAVKTDPVTSGSLSPRKSFHKCERLFSLKKVFTSIRLLKNEKFCINFCSIIIFLSENSWNSIWYHLKPHDYRQNYISPPPLLNAPSTSPELCESAIGLDSYFRKIRSLPITDNFNTSKTVGRSVIVITCQSCILNGAFHTGKMSIKPAF